MLLDLLNYSSFKLIMFFFNFCDTFLRLFVINITQKNLDIYLNKKFFCLKNAGAKRFLVTFSLYLSYIFRYKQPIVLSDYFI